MASLLDIVASRSRAEVLRILFGLQQPELHLREVVRQSGLSLGAIQQELRRMAKVGLVATRRDGNRLYYKADTSHPLHAELAAIVLKTDGLAGVLAQALGAPDVSVAFVFGSVAAGSARAASDVDLMVIGSAGLRRVTHLLSGVSGRVGREVNPHVMTPEEFVRRRVGKDHFITSVLAGPRLYVKGTALELDAMGD